MNSNHFKKYFFAAIFFFSFNSFAAGSGPGLGEMMSGLDHLDKKQIEQMIEILQKNGNISGDEAKNAKAELAKMSEDDFSGLKKKANSIIKENKKHETAHDNNHQVKKSSSTTDKGKFEMEVH